MGKNEIKEAAKFQGKFPFTAIFNDAGDLEVPNGKEAAESLVSILREAGYPATEPEQYSFYAWFFEVESGKARVELLIQGEPWILSSESKGRGFVSLKTVNQLHREVLACLEKGMSEDKKFSEIVWGSRKEIEMSL